MELVKINRELVLQKIEMKKLFRVKHREISIWKI